MASGQKNEETLFKAARKFTSPSQREAYLKEVCGDDSALFQRINALLESYENAHDFMEMPPADCQVTLDTTPLAEGPGSIIGPYKLLEKIGEGGMAVVYMAEQQRPLQRRVALKIIKLGMDTKEVIARFEAERQALALMDHPNIAKVFDAGATDTGRPYFVMELVRGVSITEYCDKNKLSTQARLELFVPVCNAVHHAHQKGIIHRDLKPSNIMVTMHDGKPVPMVIDFGIAKATNQRLTEQTIFTRYAEMIGTPEYMSPEQAEMSGLDIDTRTDIYSLGIVLYELLTGALPFDSETLRKAAVGEIQRIIREEEPPRPSTRLSALGKEAEEIATRRQTDVSSLTRRLYRELEWIPMKALRKDRTRRYRSASEFADDIANYLSGTPLIAGPESATYRLYKFVKKYQMQVMAIGAITVTLIAGLCISTTMYVRAQRALDTVVTLENRIEVDRSLVTAQRLHAEGRYEAALKEIDKLFEKQDLGSLAHLLKAQLLLEVGQLSAAQEILQPLTDATPEVAGSAHYLLAKTYLGIDSAKADQHKQQAESVFPKTAESYSLRAMTASTVEETLEWVSQALKLDPAHYPARKARCLVYYGLGNYDQLAPEVEALIALRPQDPTGYAFRAIVRREQGNCESALEDHNQTIALCSIKSERLEFHSQRQETYTRMGRHQLALADAETCVSLEPKAFTHRFRVFASLVSLGNYEAATRTHKGIIQEGYEWHRQFKWWAQKYVLNRLAQDEEFKLPAEFADRPPFPMMRETARCYASLKGRAKRIVSKGYFLGTWSPDGRYLAYGPPGDEYMWLAKSPGESLPALAESHGIQILDTDTGQTRRLTESGMLAAWSPDGKYIAYSEWGSEAGLWLVPAAGGVPRFLVNGWAPVWSKDSKRLYYLPGSTIRGKGIFSIQVDDPSAKPEQIASCHGLFSLSPDEKYLAYAFGGTEIRIIESASGEVTDRWSPPKPVYTWHVHWSPNGKEICIQSASWYGEIGLWMYDVQEKEAKQFIDSPARCAVWSPDGTKLVLSVRDEAWIVELDPNQPTVSAFNQAMSPEDFIETQLQQHNRKIAADPVHAESYLERALIHLSTENFDDAQSDLARCGELVSNSHDPMIYLTSWWGRVHHWGRRFRQAELLLLQGQVMVERFPETELPSWFRPLTSLIELYEAWDKPELAKQWRTKLPETED